jgi:hypothetical protein
MVAALQGNWTRNSSQHRRGHDHSRRCDSQQPRGRVQPESTCYRRSTVMSNNNAAGTLDTIIIGGGQAGLA